MKKTMILAAAAAMFMVTSCQKEEVMPVKDSQAEELAFTATIMNQTTKTTVNTDAASADKGKVSWEKDDEITITAGGKTAVYGIETITDGVATFKMKSGDDLPTSGVTYTATYGEDIAKEQTYSSSVKGLPMTATSTSTNLNFTVTCGLLKLNLTALDSESDKTISKIEIIGTPSGCSKTTYVLTCSDNNGVSITSSKDFYIALPAGSYNDIVFYNKGGYVCQKTNKSGMQIETNKIQPVTLGGIAFNLLPGKFSVSETKQVRFSKGNLYYSITDSKYHIEAAQNVTYATLGQSAYEATHICHFFWSNTTDWQTSKNEPWAESYSCSSQSTSDEFFCGVGNPMAVDGQSGLYALTKDEWEYLFNKQSRRLKVAVATSADTVRNCVVIAPDGYGKTIDSFYSAEAWAAAESDGLVCLPAAGYRDATSLIDADEVGYCWSATPFKGDKDNAHYLHFDDSSVGSNEDDCRSYGCSVRLVGSVPN